MYNRVMNLEDKLTNHIPIQSAAINNADAFGIEVELEGRGILGPPPNVQQYWHPHNDGSLRRILPQDECVEYVSVKPLNMEDTEKAVHYLFDYLNKPAVKVYDSYRTSIHVHVNFATESFRTIYNFMVLSLIFDELLVSLNGEHRIGNNFCLRAKDALGQVVNLANSIETGNNFFGITTNERYSSINFASLLKFGSVEFRSLECTTHAGRVMQWVRTIARLKEKAKTYRNPTEIIQQFSMLGADSFLRDVLGPYSYKYQTIPGIEEMLCTGMRIAQDVAYASEWKESVSR